jgi:hypothetical protein
MTFRKLDLFPSSGYGRETLLGAADRANPNHRKSHHNTQTNPVSGTLFFPVILNSGPWTKSTNPAILSILIYLETTHLEQIQDRIQGLQAARLMI